MQSEHSDDFCETNIFLDEIEFDRKIASKKVCAIIICVINKIDLMIQSFLADVSWKKKGGNLCKKFYAK